MLLYGPPDSRPLLEAMKKPRVARIPRSGTAMIKQAEKTYAPLELERQVQEFWERAKVYQKTVAVREKGEDFFFGDGPPATTGSIHLGQVLNKTIKDLVVRYHRMRGYHVRDQPGYDMHGLPIEVEVEKSLGITKKKEIEELGIEKCVNTCRSFATDLLKKMTAQFQSLGIWLDWDRPYMTIRNEFIEAAWWTLKHAHEREWIYEALRSIQWCSRCETALADAEVEYADETDPSIYVKFRVARKPNESLLIWTTTPWTLPANLAIAVHPDFRYAKVQVAYGKKPEYIWVMESAVPDIMARGGVTKYSVVETKKGSDLVGLAYLHPLRTKLPYQKGVKGEWVHKVVSSETVVAEYTGLVHSAPGHGPEDFELGQKLGMPAFSPVDARGHFTDDAGTYAGQSVREANPRIVADLGTAHALFTEETIVHAYGHCWRCKTPILFRATVQWFLKVTEFKPKMVEEVERVTWFPDWAGAARQLDWTSNLRDWCISRQRYWGIPLPIWRCSKCTHWTVVGSADALRKATGYVDGMDLHRPGWPADAQVPRELYRAGDRHQQVRRRSVAILRHRGERAVGRHHVPGGRRPERAPHVEHPVERAPICDDLHGPGPLRSLGGGSCLRRRPPTPGGPLAPVAARGSQEDRECGDDDVQPAPRGPCGRVVHPRRPLTLVRETGPRTYLDGDGRPGQAGRLSRALRSPEHAGPPPRPAHAAHRRGDLPTSRWTKAQRPHARLARGPRAAPPTGAGAVHGDRPGARGSRLQGTAEGRAQTPLASEDDRGSDGDSRRGRGARHPSKHFLGSGERKGPRDIEIDGRFSWNARRGEPGSRRDREDLQGSRAEDHQAPRSPASGGDSEGPRARALRAPGRWANVLDRT